MNVVFVCHDASTGETARSLLAMAQAARSAGHAVAAYLPAGARLIEELRAVGIAVVLTPLPWVLVDPGEVRDDEGRRSDATTTVLDAVAYWRSWCQRARPPHGSVVVNVGFVHPWGAVAAAEWGLPCLWSATEFGWHDLGLEPLWGGRQDYRDLVSRSATTVLVTTSYMAGELVPGHADVRVVSPTTEGRAIVRREASRPLCVAVVAAITVAHQNLLLAEAATLVESGLPVRFLLRGPADPTYLSAVSTRVAAVPGLSQRLTIEATEVDGSDDAWLGVDIAVVTSDREAFGRVGAEAMGRGIPLVYAETPTSAQVYGPHGTSGAMAFSPGSSADLAAAIRAVATSPRLRARMRRRHRKWASTRFSPSAASTLFTSALTDVAARGQNPAAGAALDSWLTLGRASLMPADAPEVS